MYTFIYKILVNAAFVSHSYFEAVHLLYVAMLRCEIFFRTPFYANIWAVFVKYMLEAELQLTDLARRTLKQDVFSEFYIGT